MIDHYTTLGISQLAKKHEIKAAYRRLALRLHPDKNLGSEAACAAFQRVGALHVLLHCDKMLIHEKLVTAYEELHDESRRALYDAKLEDERFEREFMKGYSPTRSWYYRDYESQKSDWIDPDRREKMQKARLEEMWSEREKAALDRIKMAKSNVAAAQAEIEEWKRSETKQQKIERQAQDLWTYLSSPFNKIEAESAQVKATKRQEQVDMMDSKKLVLRFAQMELERCKQSLWAVKRQRKQVREEERQREVERCQEAYETAKRQRMWEKREEGRERRRYSGRRM